MKPYLIELSVNGCKSITNEISLNFSNYIVDEYFSPDESNVKAIYGANGAGKTAIITALGIYRRLVVDRNALSDPSFRQFILANINRKTKELSVTTTFLYYDEETTKVNHIFRNNITISHLDDDLIISHQEIDRLAINKSIHSKSYKTIIQVDNGKINKVTKTNKDEVNELSKFENYVIKYSTVTSITSELDYSNTLGELKLSLLLVQSFARNLFIEIEEKDLHIDYLDTVKKLDGIAETLLGFNIPYDEVLTINYKGEDIISKSNYDKYCRRIEKITKFIQVFIEDLISIDLDPIEDGNIYHVRKYVNYGDNGKFSVEYESNGIKKLIRIFNAIHAATNGYIVFIDEFDANLHDVYFAKLVEFLRDFATGEICFTTHNLEPIEILKANKFSLDFITRDSKVYSWKKNGNSSPLNRYINGLLPYSTFNIDSVSYAPSLLDK